MLFFYDLSWLTKFSELIPVWCALGNAGNHLQQFILALRVETPDEVGRGQALLEELLPLGQWQTSLKVGEVLHGQKETQATVVKGF